MNFMTYTNTCRQYAVVAQDLNVARDSESIVFVRNLRIPNGGVAVFTGANGCGKSTLMAALGLRLRSQTRGYLEILGRRVDESAGEWRLSRLRRSIGQSPQRSPVHIDQTVGENLMFAAVVRGLSGRYARHAVDHMLGLFSLPAEMPARKLNGGRRAMLSIAMSFCGLPPQSVLIADEPTAALSVESAEILYSCLDNLRCECGHTLLLVSHDSAWLERFSDADWYTFQDKRLLAFEPCHMASQHQLTEEIHRLRQENEQLHYRQQSRTPFTPVKCPPRLKTVATASQETTKQVPPEPVEPGTFEPGSIVTPEATPNQWKDGSLLNNACRCFEIHSADLDDWTA